MTLLSILDNEVLHLVAETSVIVIGSILMGILLGYIYWGSFKKKTEQLTNKLDFERDLVFDLRNQLKQVTNIRDHLASELSDERIKSSQQSKTIYDQGLQLYEHESRLSENRFLIDHLNETIRNYEERLRIIENELLQVKDVPVSSKRTNNVHPVRANYEHVSQLLGRQVTENDLTLISGIGPRTASLLQKLGIGTWDALALTPVETLREILEAAGGNYKSIDPAHWPKQASMAAQNEWRKLRVYQETLKKLDQ